MKKFACCALVILAAGCASTQRPGEDFADLVPPPQGASAQQTAALESKIDSLQTSLTELLERLDVMNDRIGRLEAGPQWGAGVSPARTGGDAGAPPITPPPAPQPVSKALVGAQIADTYRNALMLYGRGKFEDARRTFQQVFDQDPSGELADNALYWIGETYFAAGEYSNAMRYYARVTKEYADQNKAPDALFKMGLAYVKTGDLAMARRTFEECIQKYPYSTPAASAKYELKRIKY